MGGSDGVAKMRPVPSRKRWEGVGRLGGSRFSASLGRIGIGSCRRNFPYARESNDELSAVTLPHPACGGRAGVGGSSAALRLLASRKNLPRTKASRKKLPKKSPREISPGKSSGENPPAKIPTSYAARPNVIFASTPSLPTTRSMRSVEMSFVFRFIIAVTRVREVPARSRPERESVSSWRRLR